MTYRAAIGEGLDVGVGLVTELFVVSAQEVQCPLVAVAGGQVGPGGRALAVVGEVLASLNTEQSQEAQLDHAHRFTSRIHIRELKNTKNTN